MWTNIDSLDYEGAIYRPPSVIRRCFLFDRKLLADLSRIAWETLKEFMAGDGSSIPGCACSIQTFGDFLGFNPHCHIIISDGAFDDHGNFRVTPYYDSHPGEPCSLHNPLPTISGTLPNYFVRTTPFIGF